jgi:putative DNA primase/helicase
MTFADAIRAHGLLPRGPVIADGRWRRCPTEAHPRKRNGSYKLATDGRIGWYQDFARDTEPLTWRIEGKIEQAPYDPTWIRKAQAEAAERLRLATLEAQEFYAGCKPLVGGHPYLESHGLDMRGVFGLRIDTKGWLVVPAHRGREISTVQRISADGDKRFWPGASVKGAAYSIGRVTSPFTVVCEGLATGLAIFAAVGNARVVVAFNAGNLSKVTIGDGLAVIAADNDWETEQRIGSNPGVDAATAAAEALQCGVVAPDGIEGTDFCDYRVERLAQRMAERKPKEREEDIRRTVDAELAMRIRRGAVFATNRMQKKAGRDEAQALDTAGHRLR